MGRERRDGKGEDSLEEAVKPKSTRGSAAEQDSRIRIRGRSGEESSGHERRKKASSRGLLLQLREFGGHLVDSAPVVDDENG